MMMIQEIRSKIGDNDDAVSSILNERILNEAYELCVGSPEIMGWYCFLTLSATAYIVECWEEGKFLYTEYNDPFEAGFRWLKIEDMYERYYHNEW